MFSLSRSIDSLLIPWLGFLDRKEKSGFMKRVKEPLTVGSARFPTRVAINELDARRFASVQITIVKKV